MTSVFWAGSQPSRPLLTADLMPFKFRLITRKWEADLSFRKDFIAFALQRQVLRFGEFTTKAGRRSPYFFNAGLFNDGESLHRLGEFYAKAILDSGIEFDQLFGPAYKGIPLVTAAAVGLAGKGRNVPISFNRKEPKDHGEGGVIIGAPLSGRVLIVDDVISAGTSVRESVGLIHAAGAVACGVVISLDRMERGLGELSAVQEVRQSLALPVASIATLDDLMGYLEERGEMARELQRVLSYRSQYGVPQHAP